MCRHIAYRGPAISPADLVLDAPHSLLVQSVAAQEMAWGQDNVDGWGIAWQHGAEIGHKSSAVSLVDYPLASWFLRSIESERFLAAVRQRTPGSAVDVRNSAPFRADHDRFFVHNGYVDRFRDGVRDQLLAKVAPDRAAGIRGDTDSEVLFALVLSQLDVGATATEAVGAVIDVAERHGGRFNVVLWDADTTVATRWNNSLYLHRGDAVILSSEPLDDGAWEPVPDRSMVIVDADGVREEAL
jgi:glutamine amidotransferase